MSRFNHTGICIKSQCFCYTYTILCDCFVSFLSHLSLWSTALFMRSESLIPIWAADQLVILELRDINSFPMSPLLFSPGFHGNSRETEGSLLAVKSHSALMTMLREVYTKTHICSLTNLYMKLLFRKKKNRSYK